MAKKPRTVGRPEMPDRERRTEKLPVRFSPREIDDLRERAKKTGVGLTHWIRSILGMGK